MRLRILGPLSCVALAAVLVGAGWAWGVSDRAGEGNLLAGWLVLAGIGVAVAGAIWGVAVALVAAARG